jgi:hypothetical protein
MKILFIILLVLIAGPAKAFGICWPSCTETTELDERTIVVSARGSGLWSTGLNEDLMAAAASAALQHGYSKFKLLNPNHLGSQRFDNKNFMIMPIPETELARSWCEDLFLYSLAHRKLDQCHF